MYIYGKPRGCRRHFAGLRPEWAGQFAPVPLRGAAAAADQVRSSAGPEVPPFALGGLSNMWENGVGRGAVGLYEALLTGRFSVLNVLFAAFWLWAAV